MRVKIRGGTVNGGEPPLCQTCRYATIVRGPSLRDEIVECQELMFRRGRITFPVTYCTSYSDRRQPSVREMEEIAWILRSDPKRKEIGFVHGSKLLDRERLIDIDECATSLRPLPRPDRTEASDNKRTESTRTL
jgi:hypothetical protein